MHAPTPHNRLGCITGIAVCVAMWAIIAAVVMALVGCGSKPPAAPLPAQDTPVSTSGLTKPIKTTTAAVTRVRVIEGAGRETLKGLELELLAARTANDKLAALNKLLEQSENQSKENLIDLSRRIRVVVTDAGKAITAANAKVTDLKKQAQLREAELLTAVSALQDLQAEKEKLTAAVAVADKERGDYRAAAAAESKRADKLATWREDNEHKVRLYNTIKWALIGLLTIAILLGLAKLYTRFAKPY